MTYKKFRGKVPRFVVFSCDYWLDKAWLRAGTRLGWDIHEVRVPIEGVMSKDMLTGIVRTIIEWRPDAVLTVNIGGIDEEGILAELFCSMELPHVTWFVDNPRTILRDKSFLATPHSVAVTWERAYVPFLEDFGFPHVRVLPLAADISLFNSEPPDSWSIDCAFVANSMENFVQQEWRWLSERPYLARAVREAFENRRVTRERFARGLAAIFDPVFVQSLDADERRHAELFLFIEATRLERVYLVTFLQDLITEVRGDPGWAQVTPRAYPFVPYETSLPQYYRRCAINLNQTSLQMLTAVNQRVFECPAAGGFLLTDDQETVWELFEPDEVAVYRSVEELRELIPRFLKDASARITCIERARNRILHEHTYEHRLQTLLGWLRDIFA